MTGLGILLQIYLITKNGRKINRKSAFCDARVPNILLQDQNNKGGSKDQHYPKLDDDPPRKVDFYHVLWFLAVYIGLGGLCSFLVRHQIKGKKTIEIFDAIYFCVVRMTTLGYGDLVPDSNLAKFLSCVLVFVGMALVGFSLSRASDVILEKQEVHLVKAMYAQKKLDQAEIIKEVEVYGLGYKFVTSLSLPLVLMVLGVVFLNQIKDLNLVDSFYCVCATVTSLGYGEKSFSTEIGRIFASIWILISTLCLAQTIYNLVDLYTDRRRRSLVKRVNSMKFTVKDLEAADLDHDKVVW